jgi:hypothetical protein
MATKSQIKAAREFYEALDALAVDVPREEIENVDIAPTLVIRTVRVFTGSLTATYTMAKLPMSYYTPVRKYLKENGCVQILEQGTRGYPSTVLLLHPPAADAESTDETPDGRLTGGGVSGRLTEIERRVDALMGWRESQGGIDIREVLRNMELRISRLEAERATKAVPTKREGRHGKTA